MTDELGSGIELKSPLYELLGAHEVGIADFLRQRGVITPVFADQARRTDRRGFIILSIFNCFDQRMYVRFRRGPLSMALQAQDHRIEFAQHFSAIAGRYSDVVNAVVEHVCNLVEQEKFIPFFYFGNGDTKEGIVHRLRHIQQAGASSLGFTELLQLFPNQVESAERTQTESFRLADGIANADKSRARLKDADVREAMELQGVLDLLALGFWLFPRLDLLGAARGFGEGWEAGCGAILPEAKRCKVTRCTVPISFHHSMLGLLRVGWEGELPASRAKEIQAQLPIFAAQLQGELRHLRARVATEHLARHGGFNADAFIALLGCRELRCETGSRVECKALGSRLFAPMEDQPEGSIQILSEPLEVTSPTTGQTAKVQYTPFLAVDHSGPAREAFEERILWDLKVASSDSARAISHFDLNRFVAWLAGYGEREEWPGLPDGEVAAVIIGDLLACYLLSRKEQRIKEGSGVWIMAPALNADKREKPLFTWTAIGDILDGGECRIEYPIFARYWNGAKDGTSLSKVSFGTKWIGNCTTWFRTQVQSSRFQDLFSQHGLYALPTKGGGERVSQGKAKYINIRNLVDRERSIGREEEHTAEHLGFLDVRFAGHFREPKVKAEDK
jgi:hypothetical protein